MKTYCFYTRDGFRQDVKASTAISAWNKIQSLPGFRDKFNGKFGIYNKEGLIETGRVDGCIDWLGKPKY